MSQRTIRISSVANNLFQERKRIALFEKRKHLNKVGEIVPKLNKYLNRTDKIDFIRGKLEVVNNIDNLKRAIQTLIDNLENIAEQERTKTDLLENIRLSKTLIDSLDRLKKHLKKEEQEKLAKETSSALLDDSKVFASSFIAKTESLNEDESENLENGEISHPLRKEEEIK